MGKEFIFNLNEGYRIYSRKKGFTIIHTITQVDLFVGVFSSDKFDVMLKENLIKIIEK